MEPTLVVIGISICSAKLRTRERFLLTPDQKMEAHSTLVRSSAIDEVIVVSNCNRTEFLVWTQDASEAANSVLRYLTRSRNLKLQEWSNFYRLVGDSAVSHVFRITAGIDCAVFGEPDANDCMLVAWQQAQRASTTGRFLDALMAKAFSVAGRVRQELGAPANTTTVAQAAVLVCQQSLDDLSNRRILVLGAGQMALLAVRELQNAGARDIIIVNRTWEHALHLAKQCNVRAVESQNLREQLLLADVVISAASQRILLSREELEAVVREREGKPLMLVDTAVPRTIDPHARQIDGLTLLDLDDLCSAMDQREGRRPMRVAAEHIIADEAAGFRSKLLSQSMLITISGMRERLEAICQQEMDLLRDQFGPFTQDQEVALQALSVHISQRISASLARQLKEVPERTELTSAVQQLFQLEHHNLKAKVGD